MTTYRIIESAGGTEIYFLGKTPKIILDYLKANNYRWSYRKKCWKRRAK